MDFEVCISKARVKLVDAAQLLSQEIAEYPTPIAGCDLQFNHLLEERRRVNAALQSLEESVYIPTPRRLTASE